MSKSFTLVMGAYCTNEYMDSPAYGAVEVTDELIFRIQSLQEIVKAHNLVSVRAWHEIDWHLADELRIQGDSMVVYDASFFFAAWPKYGSGKFETISIEMDVLLLMRDAIQKGQASEHDPFVIEDGVVFYDAGSDSVDYLIETYTEAEKADATTL